MLMPGGGIQRKFSIFIMPLPTFMWQFTLLWLQQLRNLQTYFLETGVRDLLTGQVFKVKGSKVTVTWGHLNFPCRRNISRFPRLIFKKLWSVIQYPEMMNLLSCRRSRSCGVELIQVSRSKVGCKSEAQQATNCVECLLYLY